METAWSHSTDSTVRVNGLMDRVSAGEDAEGVATDADALRGSWPVRASRRRDRWRVSLRGCPRRLLIHAKGIVGSGTVVTYTPWGILVS
jgi:hypothetical protein